MVAVLVSVASCRQIAEEGEAKDGDDRHDEEFHVASLLGPGVVTVAAATTPALLPQRTLELRNMQFFSRNDGGSFRPSVGNEIAKKLNEKRAAKVHKREPGSGRSRHPAGGYGSAAA